MRPRIRNIIVLTITVLAILVRPVLAYEIAASDAIVNDQKINMLFQRLVKKRDNFLYADDMEETTSGAHFHFPLPLLRAIIRYGCVAILAAISFLSFKPSYSTVFQVLPDNKCYRKLSRLRI